MAVATAAEIEAVRNSAAYKATKAQLVDRQWRLDNLYWIKDKDGKEVPFRRNHAQRTYAKNAWFRDTIVKARQLGFSTDIAMQITDDLVFRPNTVAAIIDYKLPDAEKKLEKIKFAYERLPTVIRSGVKMVKDNDAEMTLTNGSKITVGTSFRGDTPQVMHISEYGKISTDNPKAATEIKTGGIQSVGLNGKVYVESTAHGIGGEFYDMVQRAEKRAAEGAPLTRLDFKLHFFPWHDDPSYRLRQNLVTIPKELVSYFDELRTKSGLITDGDQIAWYAKKLEELGPDDMKSEYPSTMAETFFNSMEGAYFKAQMSRARNERRIGQPVPFDPTRPVNTFTDIGMDDEQAIWFHQSDGVRHRFIDFHKSSDEGLMGFIRVVREKAMSRGFIYGKHYGPHDLGTRDWSNPTVQSRAQVAEGFGIKFVVVPRVSEKIEAIEAARRMLNVSWFDSENCAEGVKALDSYRKTWNEKLGQWGNEPVHDWASHPADAYMTGAMGWRPDSGPRRSTPSFSPTGSSWAA